MEQNTSRKFGWEWRFDQEPVIELPMCRTPLLHLPSIPWIVKAVQALLGIVDNLSRYATLSFEGAAAQQQAQDLNRRAVKLLNDYQQSSGTAPPSSTDPLFLQFIALNKDLSDYVLSLGNTSGRRVVSSSAVGDAATAQPAGAQRNTGSSEWGLRKYDDIFQSLPFPDMAARLRDDRTFAYWRVAGNNPVKLQKVESSLPTKFPLTNTQYQQVMGRSDSLSQALAEQRLFILDYADIGRLAVDDGVFKPGNGVTGYAYAPIALFAVPRGEGHLMPVGIQCGQDPIKDQIFLRSEHRDYYWGWQMAKYFVNVADENHHEVYTHLGYTHLISEVFAVATGANFSNQHPIGQLLTTHFEGTIFINWGAAIGLMGPGKFFDVLFACTPESLNAETLAKRFEFDFFEKMLPRELANRGVLDASVLVEYPYRDDGLLIWTAIEKWVGEYVRLFYRRDSEVQSDQELSNWADNIIQNGRIKGFKRITSIDALVEVLTMVIFTASAQHAAVNFSQPDWMTYAPAATAMAVSRKPFSQFGRSNADWLNLLNTTNQALTRTIIYTLLGGVYHGGLGQYHKDSYTTDPIFTDVRVVGPGGLLDDFRNRLQEIEAEINQRNSRRYFPYEYLLPSRIPASTNI